MKKSLLYLTAIFLFFAMNAYAEESIFFKSDSSWKATDVFENGWFGSDFNDKHWSVSIGSWSNNPCSYYCESLKSCELSCYDWMWYLDNCSNCTRYFRKEISVPEEVTYGRIQISADDFYQLYVNGKKVGEDFRDFGYQTYSSYDITNELHSGKNIIAIKAYNKEKYQGVLVSGEVRYKDVSQIEALESRIELLNSQIVVLTEDKKRLQDEVDKSNKQLDALRTEKDARDKQLNALELEKVTSNEEKTKMGGTILQQRILLVIAVIAILILGFFAYSVYQENKKLKEKRKPTLRTVPSSSSEYKKPEPSEEEESKWWEE